jgi:MYXO-CTERM domain-containing protein
VRTSDRGQNEAGDGDEVVSDTPRASGGCSVVNAGSSAGFSALAMLGVALGFARRRRR